MKIHIEDKLYIESDEMQYILKKYTGKKDSKGRDTYIIYGYYGSIQQALKKVLKLKIHRSTATNLKELLDEIKRIEDFLKEQVKC